ncbi:hypothetical protein VP1G_07648 [Cytospora mali]|uniref:Centromere protein H C-terminal domain-containing protein n=1 Tax=Cytospora mali TaxID=578113 RepID=A0A194V994_CYTMA|nr:hypothetical protein VP1G_07648 [Valsa mali var. pyri (nom. inval.)]
MDDLQMQDVADEKGTGNQTLFSGAEKEILDLYDQVKELELEIALAKARTRLADESARGVGRGGDAESEDDEADASLLSDQKGVDQAREQLLEAMALYNLRDTVVENVLSTNPILKGIHNSTYASPIEEDIQDWIRTRDDTSHSVAKQSSSLRQVLDQLTEVESDTLRVSRKNRDLAAEVLRLAKEADRDKTDAIADDPAAKEQIVKLEARLTASKQKWRVMKGTASGIVAGSGVDWARDAELRDVVLDPE